MGTVILALFLIHQEEPKFEPGPYKVKVRQAAFHAEASSLSDVVRKAKYGEEVNLTGTARNGKVLWAQVEIDGGKKAFIVAKSLVTPKEFKEQAEGSEESGSMAAEGYKGSRFDPKTEEGYSQKQNLGPAYAKVNDWCGQPEAKDENGKVVKPYLPGKPAWKNDRASMLLVLRQFRRDGNLGEFAGQH